VAIKSHEGIDVRVVDFGDSSHVGHFDAYPEKYNEEIEQFVAKVGLLD
jgi:hypothetical protein